MGAGRSYFRDLRLVAQFDPDTLIEITLDIAPGPGAQPIALLDRSDGAPCGNPNWSHRNLHARGYKDQKALEFSLRVRFTKQITGYTPRKVRRATATYAFRSPVIRGRYVGPEFRSWWAREGVLRRHRPLWVLGFRGL
jgi:hypothetical protein